MPNKTNTIDTLTTVVNFELNKIYLTDFGSRCSSLQETSIKSTTNQIHYKYTNKSGNLGQIESKSTIINLKLRNQDLLTQFSCIKTVLYLNKKRNLPEALTKLYQVFHRLSSLYFLSLLFFGIFVDYKFEKSTLMSLNSTEIAGYFL